MRKCVICDRRPAKEGAFCANCNSHIEAERNARQADKPVKFLTYRGHVVGMYPNGNGKLIARLLKRSPKYLPKSRTLDLNTYLHGFTRDKIKAFKRTVLSLANA